MRISRLPRLLSGLGAKLALFSGVMVMLATSITVTANSLTEQARLEARLHDHAGDLARLLGRFAASYYYDLRVDELKVALEDVIAGGEVRYAYVLDGQNTVLVDGTADADMMFTTVDDPLADAARGNEDVQFAISDDMLHAGVAVPFGKGEVGIVRLGVSLAGVHRDVARLRHANLVMGGALGCIGLLASLLLARRVTKPLAELSIVTERVARGDFSQRVAFRSNDEIGQLAAHFNHMVEHVEESARRIEHMAFYDGLTGLPNRMLFARKLEAALHEAGSERRSAVVLCLDLDQFKEVNDTLGHAAGDLLLRMVALRLQACLGERGLLARLGGDEFAIVHVGNPSLADMEALCQSLLLALASPVDLDGHEFVIGTSIGVATFPQDGEEANTLMKNADLALYRAKAEGRSTYRFFEAVMHARLKARKALEQDMRHALSRGEIELHYQPQVDSQSRCLVGVEALMRWRHPVRGMVSPAEFIPVAEDTGMIVELGAHALRTACNAAARWPTLKVAVNLSPVQFRQADLGRVVAEALAESGLPANRLELEITEGVLLNDTDATLATLAVFRHLGVGIALDDFGTGYSSLSYLRCFPFGKLKIDRSFVVGLGCDPEAAAIVRAIIVLGQTLGMRTNAEGVETEEQAAILRQLGCDEAQGYLHGRPQPAPAIDALVQATDALKVAA